MDEVKVTFVGDMMCQMQQILALKRAHMPYDVIFEKMKPVLQTADYVVGNLESPIAGKRMRYAFEEVRFNAPDDFLIAIKNLGVDFVSLANNHCLDRGPRGLDVTIGKVREAGFDSTGAYLTREESEKVFVSEIGGIRFAFISCTFETNQGRKSDLLSEDQMWKVDQLAPPQPFRTTFSFAVRRFAKSCVPYGVKVWLKRRMGKGLAVAGDHYLADSAGPEAIGDLRHAPFVERIKGKIAAARKMSDVVIVLPHMGGQYNPEPGPFQKWTVDWMVKAGADVVICNHAHTVLQTETKSNGAFVAYALGNFSLTPGVGYYRRGCQADFSVVLNLTFDVRTKRIVKRTFSVTENKLLDNGSSVVVPADPEDEETRAVVKRFSGTDARCDDAGEYVF